MLAYHERIETCGILTNTANIYQPNLARSVTAEVGFLKSQSWSDSGRCNLGGARCPGRLEINVKELNVSDCQPSFGEFGNSFHKQIAQSSPGQSA